MRTDHPDVRLFFLGMKHPNPGVPAMRVANETRELAESLGLTGKYVFFNEGWVDYDDRHNYLLEADAGVSTHFVHVETEFSFRTRILDYLWAGLPIVATEGDGFADLVRDRGLGLAVPPGDARALADAIRSVLYDDRINESARREVGRARADFEWSAVLAPLIDFCASPKPAADPIMSRRRIVRRPILSPYAPIRLGRRLVGLWRQGGVGLVRDRAVARWTESRR